MSPNTPTMDRVTVESQLGSLETASMKSTTKGTCSRIPLSLDASMDSSFKP